MKAATTRLIKKAQELRENRRINKVKSVRKAPNATERKQIYKKTDGKCHICGGSLGRKWHADHVLPHASGGHGIVDNFLGSCSVCNGARWFYTPEEILLILKIGGLSLSEIRKETELGRDIARKYVARQKLNKSRRT